MNKYLDDIFIGFGCVCLISATVIDFGIVAAIYVTGVIFIVLGVLIGRGIVK